jgi:hypothetical protein
VTRANVRRHDVPAVEDVEFNGEEGIKQILVSARCGEVTGNLIRWVWDDGEVVYETQVSGLPDAAGFADFAAAQPRTLMDLSSVCYALLREWRAAMDAFPARPGGE